MPDPPSQRCLMCRQLLQRILNNPADYNSPYEHHEEFKKLENSAISGCDVCASIRQRLILESLKHGCDTLDGESYSILGSTWSHNPDNFEPGGYFTTDETIREVVLWIEKKYIRVELRCIIGCDLLPEGKALFGNQTNNKICDWPTSSSFNLARDWMTSCVREHACSSVAGTSIDTRVPFPDAVTPFLPTRVIDVGTAEEPQQRLVLGDNRHAQYTALSYCWGRGAHEYVTTQSNLNARLNSFDTEQLPKTIKEAVIITKNLGVRYLWVDALCIIQNEPDLEDWKKEASKMCDVYQNSICTIAAAGAEDNDGGCFTGRYALSIPASACFATNDLPTGNSLIFEPIPLDIDWGHSVDRGSLNKRGWVFQETLLSPRTLYWTKAGLFWECMECRLSQFDVEGKTLNEQGPLGWSAKKNKAMRNIICRPPTDVSWFRIVERYSQMYLTFAKDRLVALSGLVNSVSKHTDDVFLAGLWKSQLIPGLTWTPLRSGRIGSETVPGPSWSWVSLDTGVKWEYARDLGEKRSYKWNAEVLEADVSPVSDDAPWNIISGGIMIAANTTIMRLGNSEEYDAYRFSPDAKAEKGWSLEEYDHALELDRLPEPSVLSQDLLCIQLGTVTFHGRDRGRGKSFDLGLILNPTSRVSEYKRLGFCSIKSSERRFSKRQILTLV